MTKKPNPSENSQSTKDTKAPSLPPGLGRGGPASYASKMMRSIVESTPTMDAKLDLSDLPDIRRPNLSGIDIVVPEPALTEDIVMESLEILYYNHAERTIREAGEAVEFGDELRVDWVGFIEGKLLPFSPEEDLIIRLEEDMMYPGFGQALKGSLVGDTANISITFPDDHDIEVFRNRTAVFVVQIKAAATPAFIDPNSPEMLERIGRGNTLKEVVQSITEELEEFNANAMVLAAIDMTLEKLCQRVTVSVPEHFIDEEIRFWWRSAEGDFLHEKGLERQDIDDALQAWLQDEETREEAERRLKIAMVVKAFVKEQLEEIQQEELMGFLDEFSETLGVDAEEWRQVLSQDQAEQESLLDKYLYMRTISHIMGEVNVQYGG